MYERPTLFSVGTNLLAYVWSIILSNYNLQGVQIEYWI